jgi:putative tricarboxylic transport membrane protein
VDVPSNSIPLALLCARRVRGRSDVSFLNEGALSMTEGTAQRPGERIFLWLLLAFGFFVLITAFMIPHLENLSSSGAFPIFIASVLILSVVRVLWKQRGRYAALSLPEELKRVRPFALPGTVLGYAIILVLYILTTAQLHFLSSSFGFLVISFIFLKGASPLRSVMIGAGTLAGMYVLFQTIFKVMLW